MAITLASPYRCGTFQTTLEFINTRYSCMHLVCFYSFVFNQIPLGSILSLKWWIPNTMKCSSCRCFTISLRMSSTLAIHDSSSGVLIQSIMSTCVILRTDSFCKDIIGLTTSTAVLLWEAIVLSMEILESCRCITICAHAIIFNLLTRESSVI
jgi:hypothetical protein